MLHGFAQNRLAFTAGRLPAVLVERGARVLLGEMRGHGLSRLPKEGQWSLETHLRLDVPALVRRACELGGVPRLHLMGHSMGGMLGYAMLARSRRLWSLATFGAPVVLGVGKPILRAAAHVASPLVRAVGPSLIPMDHFLRAIGPLASRPAARGPVGWFRDLIRLANPAVADPTGIREILSAADPVAKQVFLQLTGFARHGRAVIDGTDLAEAVAESPLPVAAVVGSRDVFGGRASVEAIDRGPGPRRIVVLEDAAHVDVTMGHELGRVAEQLWPFLCSAERHG